MRDYLPAFMLWLFDNYDDGTRRDSSSDLAIIGTMVAIAPGEDIRVARYAAFDGCTPQQRAAIAAYGEAIPRLVELGREGATRVERALRDYRRRFLPGRSAPPARPSEGRTVGLRRLPRCLRQDATPHA